MKSVLISIQPKWCELIASGKKTVEVRKTKPKLETPFKVYIYETQGRYEDLRDCRTFKFWDIRQKVIGEFVCDEVFPLWSGYSGNNGNDCLTFNGRERYLGFEKDGSNKMGYGWHISNLVIYDKPRELNEFRTLCKYRNEDGSCQYTKVDCDCVKFDYNPDYSVNFAECCDFMIRPPQSWCYVESEEGYQMNDELKPCPLCGGEVVIEKNELDSWVVRCTKCPLDFGRYWYAKKQQVKNKWNRRVGNDR